MPKPIKTVKKYYVKGRADKENVVSEYTNLLSARVFARHLFRQGNLISLTNFKGIPLAI